MSCMRCGKKTEGKNVFCADCLAKMENYPVKPGTVIQIPVRQISQNRKQPRRRKELSPEEQLANAHGLIRFMTTCILSLIGALILSGVMLFYVMTQSQEEQPQAEQPTLPTGRNYTVIVPAEDK